MGDAVGFYGVGKSSYQNLLPNQVIKVSRAIFSGENAVFAICGYVGHLQTLAGNFSNCKS